jgi:ABC-2 type transport system ATP-binding protein
MSAIECINLERVYTSKGLFGKKQETQALKGISFSIAQGTVFGLLGPNGSGKTTTMRILATLLTPTAGSAFVMGKDCSKNPTAVRKHIGLILGGDRGLYGRLTGRENLRYFAALNNMPSSDAEKRITSVLEQVNLTEAANILTEKYSKGMKQRLHIARGILTDPDVLLMDEPTIGLDPEGAHELRVLIPQMTARGKTILLTTHYMSEADELSDNIAIIRKGVIAAHGTPGEVKRKLSRTAVMEIILRKDMTRALPQIQNLSYMKEIVQVTDGPIQKLTLYMQPDTDARDETRRILGAENIEYMAMRESTLEEAYLSIVQQAQ